MTADIFADRMVRVRDRFVSGVEDKIGDARAAIPYLSDAMPAAAAALGDVYRSIHSVVGIGSTIGFPAIGHAARHAEDALRAAYRDGRGLTANEISLFRDLLNALREVASNELQSFHRVGK